MTQPIQSIEDTILALTAARGPDKSICPSEVARAVSPEGGGTWQSLLGPVRKSAVQLALAGRIDILRKGQPIDPRSMKGVIRLRTRRADPATDGDGV